MRWLLSMVTRAFKESGPARPYAATHVWMYRYICPEYSTLCTMHCTLSAACTVHYMHGMLYSEYYVLCAVHRTLDTGHWTLHTAHCTACARCHDSPRASKRIATCWAIRKTPRGTISVECIFSAFSLPLKNNCVIGGKGHGAPLLP